MNLVVRVFIGELREVKYLICELSKQSELNHLVSFYRRVMEDEGLVVGIRYCSSASFSLINRVLTADNQ